MDLRTFTDLLNNHYLYTFNTVLEGGYNEPFYKPPGDGQTIRIQFTRDYIRSAMHELAHWCIAGKKRRMQDDFGYWYAPTDERRISRRRFSGWRCVPRPSNGHLPWYVACRSR